MIQVGDRVEQIALGKQGVVTELMTLPTGQKCVWVKFDGRKKSVMRIIQVMEKA